MASSITIKVDGLQQLGERMAKLSADMSTKIARAATGAAAGIVKKEAARRAPVAKEAYVVRQNEGDKGVLVQPKNLGKNVIMKKVKSNLTSEHIVTLRAKRKDGYARRIGTLQEYGTANMPAQPFLRPAFDENTQKAIDAMKDRIEKRLTKAGV